MSELTRRAVLARGAGVASSIMGLRMLGVIGQGATVAEAATPTSAQTNANRAVAAYNAMQRNFLVQDGTSLYRLTYPWSRGSNLYSYVCEFSRALVGTLALAGVPSDRVGGT